MPQPVERSRLHGAILPRPAATGRAPSRAPAAGRRGRGTRCGPPPGSAPGRPGCRTHRTRRAPRSRSAGTARCRRSGGSRSRWPASPVDLDDGVAGRPWSTGRDGDAAETAPRRGADDQRRCRAIRFMSCSRGARAPASSDVRATLGATRTSRGRRGAPCGECGGSPSCGPKVARPCGDRHGRSHSDASTTEKAQRGHSDRPDRHGVPARREPQHADARRRPAALREARGRGPQLRPRDVRVDARRRGDRAAVPQAPAPLARAPPASWSGSRTTSSTSSTTSGTARCPSRAGSASSSTCAGACTAPGSPGSGRCGRRTSSRGCATAGWRSTPRSTTPWSTASPRCGCCRACSAPTPTSATCPRRGTHAPRRERPPRPPSDGGLAEIPTAGAAVRARHHRRGRRACPAR